METLTRNLTAKECLCGRIQRKPLIPGGWVSSGKDEYIAVKARRVGGSTHQVPIEIGSAQGKALAVRWLLGASRIVGFN